MGAGVHPRDDLQLSGKSFARMTGQFPGTIGKSNAYNREVPLVKALPCVAQKQGSSARLGSDWLQIAVVGENLTDSPDKWFWKGVGVATTLVAVSAIALIYLSQKDPGALPSFASDSMGNELPTHSSQVSILAPEQKISPRQDRPESRKNKHLHSESPDGSKIADFISGTEVAPLPEEEKPVEKLVMPEWDLIFNPGGTFKDELDDLGARVSNGIPDYMDIYQGIRADFIQDNISNGVATDMSALLDAVKISDEVLYNGVVSPEHDLGNAYFLATRNEEGGARVFVGIERLFVPTDSFIEIEFNQIPVSLGSGTSWWKISGERMDGDLLARLNFSGGRISHVEFEVWQGDSYTLLDNVIGSPGKGCKREKAFVYCGGMPPIRHPEKGFEVWDENYVQLEPVQPDDFVQIGIDITMLTGQSQTFGGVLIRTPQDIAINSFYRPGFRKQVGVSVNTRPRLFSETSPGS